MTGVQDGTLESRGTMRSMKDARFLVSWRLTDGTVRVEPHTAKPTALGHLRGLQRNPKVEAVVVVPIEQEHPNA